MGLLSSTFYANLQHKQGHFYPKNKFQEVTEKNINVLHTEMQRYYSKFKYRNLKTPWKSIKVTLFHSTAALAGNDTFFA